MGYPAKENAGGGRLVPSTAVVRAEWDFAAMLGDGEYVVLAEIDAADSGLSVTGVKVSGTEVTARLASGTPAADPYTITCTATTSAGQVIPLDCLVVVS